MKHNIDMVIKVDDSRLRDLVNFIGEYHNEYGYSPSIRDIQDALDISSTSVVIHRLGILERYGIISRTKGINRSIVLKDKND